MHLHLEGHGPPLVLIHGWAMHGGVFAPLLRELSAHFECHVVDLPGHGLSEERDGLDLDRGVDRLLAMLPPAPWLGWSLGGMFALEAAVRAPDRVSALIGIAASPRFVVAPDWPHAVEHAVFEQFGADLSADYRATIERFIALEVHGDAHARDEIRWLRERLAERPPSDPRILVDGLAILADGDLRSELPRLTVPSLWIAGQRDRLVPWQAMRDAAAMAPGGQFQRIDRAGHAPFLRVQSIEIEAQQLAGQIAILEAGTEQSERLREAIGLRDAQRPLVAQEQSLCQIFQSALERAVDASRLDLQEAMAKYMPPAWVPEIRLREGEKDVFRVVVRRGGVPSVALSGGGVRGGGVGARRGDRRAVAGAVCGDHAS